MINSKIYDFAGKNYYLLCIRLDYSSLKEAHILNDLCATKTSNNIATMPGSVFDSNHGIPDSVEVNMKYLGETKFYFKNGDTDELKWLLRINGLTQSDLNFCQ